MDGSTIREETTTTILTWGRRLYFPLMVLIFVFLIYYMGGYTQEPFDYSETVPSHTGLIEVDMLRLSKQFIDASEREMFFYAYRMTWIIILIQGFQWYVINFKTKYKRHLEIAYVYGQELWIMVMMYMLIYFLVVKW